jgi:predicted DNA-binding protein with PD1-like motif
MRHIVHPGPAAPEGTCAVSGAPVPLRFTLEPGCTVEEATAKGFEASGCSGGIMRFTGMCEPFRFVIPALSPDGLHVAWYSDTFSPAGPVTVERACAIVGEREGRPFIHCHGMWTTAAGLRMGHLLAAESTVAEPIEAVGIGFRDATFRALPDAETNFTLFEPVRVAREMAESGQRALLAKVRPNQEIGEAVEGLCSRHGIRSAVVHGIGSLNGIRFADGREVASHATEILIRDGRVEALNGRPTARLEIDAVDLDGRIHSGELARGDNPVCITFELVIEAAV